MATNYSTPLPHDKGGNAMQEFNVQAKVIAATVSAAAESSLFSINPNTTTIEVAAPNGAVAIRWIPVTETAAAPAGSVITVAGTANFDHIIPAAGLRRFVIPRETQGQTSGQNGSIHGLYQRFAAKSLTAGVASVLVSEF